MPEEVIAETPTSEAPAADGTILTEGIKSDDAKSNADGKTLLTETSDKGEKEVEGDDVEGKEEVKKEVPEKYEIKLPDGVAVDATMMDGLTPVFKEIGLTGEQVQKLADAYAPLVKQQVEASQKAAIDMWQQQTNTWKEESKKILGTNAAKEIGYAAKAIEKSGVKGLRETLDETGIGNNPALVQFFAWAGKLVSQDNFVDSSSKSENKGSFTDIYTHPTSKATLK
jgi:hypothetical protein